MQLIKLFRLFFIFFGILICIKVDAQRNETKTDSQVSSNYSTRLDTPKVLQMKTTLDTINKIATSKPKQPNLQEDIAQVKFDLEKLKKTESQHQQIFYFTMAIVVIFTSFLFFYNRVDVRTVEIQNDLLSEQTNQTVKLFNNEMMYTRNQILQLNDNILQVNEKIVQQIGTSLNHLSQHIQSHEGQPSQTSHDLILEFVKHIVTIENNLYKMNPEESATKRIQRAVQRMHDALKVIEYEVTPLLGTTIKEGHIIEIDRREPDSAIEINKTIVINVIKAEILYKGTQIQRAKVDVKFNPNT